MVNSYSKIDPNISNFKLIKRLWTHISNKRKNQIKLLIIIMLISGIAEIISIGSLFPFLAVLTNSENLLNNNFFKVIYQFLGISNQNQLIFWMTFLFCSTVCASALIRLINIWTTGRLCAALGSDLSAKAYSNTLYQTYPYHLNKNSSDLIASLTIQTNFTISVIESLLLMFSAVIILLSILLTLFFIDKWIALFLIVMFIFFYSLVRRFNRTKLVANGKKIDRITKTQVRIINEGFGSIKDTLLQNNQRIYVNEYRNRDIPLRSLAAQNNLLASSPRFILEALGLSLISIAACFTIQSRENFSEIIPILGSIALGTQKILPTSQIIYSSWALLGGCKASLISVLNLLELPLSRSKDLYDSKHFFFKDKIVFKDVYFRYKEKNQFVIKNLNFSIKAGEKVGFVGTTGSGKTTTVDLLMSLLKPSKGKIYVDGKELNENDNFKTTLSWRKNIAHVPQNIFLTDGTILENIAFGIPKNEIDFLKVKKSAKKARISDFIDKLPYAYNSKVGERGAQLSGGQIQRIAIARALYQDASVLIFDEATSSLDNATEKDIINSINSLSKDLTIIIIAHRVSTLMNCNRIFELNQGTLVNVFTGKEFKKNFISGFS